MSDDVELEEVVALRECRAELERLRDLLALATNDQETYDYRRGLAAGVAAGLERAAKMCDELVGKYPAWHNDDVCLHLAAAIRAAALPLAAGTADGRVGPNSWHAWYSLS